MIRFVSDIPCILTVHPAMPGAARRDRQPDKNAA
jgi:hypothetical protein